MIERIMNRIGWIRIDRSDAVRALAVQHFDNELSKLRAELNYTRVRLDEARRPIIVAPHRDSGGRIMLVISR